MDGTAAAGAAALLPPRESVREPLDAVSRARACEMVSKYFPDAVDEIRHAVFGPAAENAASLCETEVVSGKSRTGTAILAVFDDSNDVKAAAVLFSKRIERHGISVLEIAWCGAEDKGLGWGSKLFEGIVKKAGEANVDAILSTSTNSALTFWLTRTNVRIADAVLRSASRGSVEHPSRFGFKLASSPTSSNMEKLYTEVLLRNRKGRVVGEFEGKPYHYSIGNSNHVWYVLNPKLSLKCKVHKMKPNTHQIAVSSAKISVERSAEKI